MSLERLSEPPRAAELVVVGGGVVGAATAFHAARAGLRPLVLERRPALATLTTGAAAGGYRLQFDNEEEVRLVRESLEVIAEVAEAAGPGHDPRVRPHGYLWVTTEEARAAEQRRLVEAQRAWGLDDVELLDGDEARRRFPYLAPEVLQARFRQADGLLDPRRLALAMVSASGARVVTGCEVTGFRLSGGRLAGVETAAGRVATETAVVAAGPFSGVVARAAGVDLPVTTVARQKLVLPETPEVPPGAPMTVDEDTGAHWRPTLAGACLLFTDPATPPTPPADPVPTDPGFAFALLDPASPVSVARVSPFWREVWERGSDPWMLQAGQYTMTPDRRPLIGPTPVPGLYVNTGYSGHGVMGSPAGSRHLVEVILGKAGENAFRPDRAFEERPRGDPL